MRQSTAKQGFDLKIIISGATGFVGVNIVKNLSDAGAELLLVGRSISRIKERFPNIEACTYETLDSQAHGFDLFVHLAAINNDREASLDDFHEVNVALPLEMAALAKAAGVRRFVCASSIHALDDANTSLYASTKRECAQRLNRAFPGYALTLYLPAIYGTKWAGKLGPLNRVPLGVAKRLFSIFAALKPTLSTNTLATFLLKDAASCVNDCVILTDGQQQNAAYKAIRRIIDLIFAFTVTLTLWWLLGLVWIATRLESFGPGIFAQKRIGRDGRVFTCYKFRTMKLGTAEAATNMISARAVTRIGHILRGSKVDELPQVVNIFRNEISLVGPRPCLPVQHELIEARRTLGVLALKPGITGLAQVNGIDMSEPEKLARWDARYAALQCLTLDFKIMVATARGRGGGDRVAEPGSQGAA